MRILLMGPPGAGKGTQAGALAKALDIPSISTGDIFRANVAEGTELGIAARRHMDAGEYVPDTLTNDMVRQRLADPDAARGFLLDGYPRTLAQVDKLDQILEARGGRVELAVCLEVNLSELQERLIHRAQLAGRSDDTEDVIARRLRLYAHETQPILGLYRARGILRSVNGHGDVSTVTGRVLAAFALRTQVDNAPY